MALESASQESRLEAIMPTLFRGTLSKAERRMLRVAPECQVGPCGPGSGEEHLANDPKGADSWDRDREVRAELIRWLCIDPQAAKILLPGGIQAFAAKITGKLDLSYASIPFPIRLTRCYIVANCDLRFVNIPMVYLAGSITRGVDAARIQVRHHIFLNDGFSARGEVSLIEAEIGGNLSCEGGRFENPDKKKTALIANGADIRGSVFFRDAQSDGEVNLVRIRIGGNLDCAGGTFSNPGRKAVNADSAEIKGNVFLRNRFSAKGEVNLVGSSVGGTLDCQKSDFEHSQGIALNAARIEVKGNALLGQDSSVNGIVNLSSARIGLTLDVDGWKPQHLPTELDLSSATAGSISDNDTCWPASLELDGFVYGGISGGPTQAEARLKWLDRQPEFAPQPYRQLARVLRELGDDDGAKCVQHELETRTRVLRRQSLYWPLRWFRFGEDVLSDATIGYGVYPARAVRCLLGLTALGWLVHWRAQRMKAMAPTDKEAYAWFHDHQGNIPDYYEPFNPLIYSLENCTPLVKFGQDDHWHADPNAPIVQTPPPLVAGNSKMWSEVLGWLDRLTSPLDRWLSPSALRWFRWILIGLGWLLATFFVAGVSGIIKTN